jgi:hypothetical protein
MEITSFDAAVFADLGYPLVTPSGDYNGNHSIDASDYVVWRKSLGQTGFGLKADGNLNNQIDSGDFAFWRSRFGQTAGSGSSLESLRDAFVPEPDGGHLIVVLLGVLGLRRFPRQFFG